MGTDLNKKVSDSGANGYSKKFATIDLIKLTKNICQFIKKFVSFTNMNEPSQTLVYNLYKYKRTLVRIPFSLYGARASKLAS